MIKAVEGLSRVDEEKEVLFVVIEFIIIHASELFYIILPQSPFYKPLLPGISNGVHCIHYDVGYDGG